MDKKLTLALILHFTQTHSRCVNDVIVEYTIKTLEENIEYLSSLGIAKIS